MKVFVKLFAEFNLGDDLFLKILLERYPNTYFYLNARTEYRKAFHKYENLEIAQIGMKEKGMVRSMFYKGYKYFERRIFPALYKTSISKRLRRLYRPIFQRTDIFVSIGGSIFMQPKKLSVYTDIEFYNLVNEYFDEIFYLGCNFGPYSDPSYKTSYNEIFKTATDVCFRERFSQKLFSEIEIVRCRPDIVFGLDNAKPVKKEKTVGFSVISARNNIDETKYIKKYAELIQFYIEEGYDIYLFSFCNKQKDDLVINKIIKRLNSPSSVNKVLYDGDIDRFLRVYSLVEKMFCGRFHAMILSMLYGQQIYPLIYSEKMTNVLDDIGYEGKVVRIENFHQIVPAELDKQISLNKYNIDKQKGKSKEQFQKLDEFLN